MNLDEIRRIIEEVRQRAKSPAFLVSQDQYLCLLWPTIKDKARTPYTRQKNRRMV
jgi:hypothetical protein